MWLVPSGDHPFSKYSLYDWLEIPPRKLPLFADAFYRLIVENLRGARAHEALRPLGPSGLLSAIEGDAIQGVAQSPLRGARAWAKQLAN
ncbi:hypothetical protein [Singulisphaera sp. PoT]|uniref:hypothetical protein n=1 Tax=Singulisphaera sp. PoT TaxID=3411797 RepID=UPI003BF5ED51